MPKKLFNILLMKKILLNLDYLTPKNYSIISKSKLGSVTEQTKTFSSNQIKKTEKWDEKTAKIGQACVQFYKTKILHVLKMESMHEISMLKCHMY